MDPGTATIIVAAVGAVSAVVSSALTLWFTRGTRKSQAGQNTAEASSRTLDSLSASYVGLIDAHSRRISILEAGRIALEDENRRERLARRQAENRIEQLSERLEKAFRLASSLEENLEQERAARRLSESKSADRIEDLIQKNEALAREVEMLQTRLEGPT